MQEPQETWVQSLSWKGPLEKGITLQYSCLENPMDRGAWRATVTLCDPMDGSPPGSPVPGILQARTLEWVAISFSNA